MPTTNSKSPLSAHCLSIFSENDNKDADVMENKDVAPKVYAVSRELRESVNFGITPDPDLPNLSAMLT
jgi:hypothetical protein